MVFGLLLPMKSLDFGTFEDFIGTIAYKLQNAWNIAVYFAGARDYDQHDCNVFW